MIRNSIRKTKENHSSIEELKEHYHGHGSRPPVTPPPTQYNQNTFQMMNTLMVITF